MHLTSFKINSYRSCINTRFPLNKELTALIGANGSGKSNILNAIVLLTKLIKSRIDRDIDTSTPKKCKIAVEIDCDGTPVQIKADIVFETDERNIDDVYATDLKFNFQGITNESAWVRFPFPFSPFHYQRQFNFKFDEFLTMGELRRIAPFIDKSQKAILSNKKIMAVLSKITDYLNSISYYSASQFSDPSRCPVSIELEEGRPVRRVRWIGHEQFILDLYKSYKEGNTQYKRYINTVGPDGIGLVNEIEFTEVEMPSSSYEVKTGGKINKVERTRLLIVPRITINDNELSPNQLSEGTFKTLALVFYILTDDSRLLLIEEPEVCVHHGLLNSIISLIETQSKQKQIIMSTHSDFVLDRLQPENLLLVKRSQDKGTVANTLSSVMSKDNYKSLHTYLDRIGNLGEYWRETGFESE
ncbi:ATP-binding protein [Dehalogenimonas sp. THU2]|uniref:AAA family ATPase n=1 Tax=Dehalogenimonas sp. THU2 TaxID=3151121 RepID=UPI0032186325